MVSSKGALLSSIGCLVFAVRALSQQPATANASGSFSIQGAVVEHASGRPLNKVMVTVIRMPQGVQQVHRVTSDDGRFVFNNLPAGKYSLWAQARGYAQQSFREDGQYSTAIVAGPGLDSEHILFPLAAPGSISGNVIDEDGDPVRQAQVWLLRRGVFSGKSEITMQGAKQTDSSGGFEFSHLSPGTYFVGVQARPWYAENTSMHVRTPVGQESAAPAENPEPSSLDVVYPTTYYADTVDSTAASPITVAEGGNANIQITLRAVPALHIQLTGYEPKPDSSIGANAFEIGPGGNQNMGGGNAMMMNNGNHWELVAAPGRYILSVQAFGNGRVDQLGATSIDLTSSGSIDMNGIRKTSVAGQVVFEGNEKPGGQTMLLFVALNGARAAQAPVEADGSFSVKDAPLWGGRYRIELENGLAYYYLKSIDVKGATFSGSELDIPYGASVQLSLVAAKGVPHVNGIAMKDDKPFAGAMVLLIPQDLNRSDLIRRDQSDSDGTFTLNDVAPGRYTAVAIDDGHDLEYAEPSVIRPYLSLGQAVNVVGQNSPELKVSVATRRP